LKARHQFEPDRTQTTTFTKPYQMKTEAQGTANKFGQVLLQGHIA